MCKNSSSFSPSTSRTAHGTDHTTQAELSSLPTDVILAMRDVCYDVVCTTPKKYFCDTVVTTKKRLLHEINFYAKKGTCNGIIGRSGAGKTSIIDIFTGRREQSRGQLYVPETVAYIPQTSTLYGTLTVKETFEFAAALKLPASFSREERAAKVKECIEFLGLSDRVDTLVEGTGGEKTLSGGEMRRIYVGRELVTLPEKSNVVLFLDEPTTGLDASSSRQLVALLCSLAENTGCTIVMSVHNPRFTTFSQFYSVSIIEMGYMVYCDIPMNLKRFLQDLGLDCPEQENIADFVIDVLSEGQALPSSVVEGGSFEDGCKNVLAKDKSPSAYKETDLFEGSLLLAMHRKCSLGFQFEIPMGQLRYCKRQNENASTFRTSMFLRIAYLWERNIRDLIRSPVAFRVMIFSRILMGLLMVILYNNKSPTDIIRLQNLSGLCFFSMFNMVFTVSSETVHLLTREIDIFRDEGANHYYTTLEFFLTKIATQALFIMLVPSVIYCSIVYYAVHFRRGFKYFFYFNLTVFLVVLCSYSFINMVILLNPRRLYLGQIIAPTLLSVMVVFSGAFVRVSSTPSGLMWLPYFSIFYVGYGSLISNEITGRMYDCSESNILNQNCDTISGKDFIKIYYGHPLLDSKWYYVANLVGFILFLNLITYIQLLRDLKWRKV